MSNLFPNPDLSGTGPFALCAKCHDLTQIIANTSFAKHSLHVGQKGFSCSVCHTSHGMGAVSPNVSGERMVNFDANVVGQNGSTPISYNRALQTCTLVCHGVAHGGSGVGNVVAGAGPVKK